MHMSSGGGYILVGVKVLHNKHLDIPSSNPKDPEAETEAEVQSAKRSKLEQR
jgi:hypothetical protein